MANFRILLLSNEESEKEKGKQKSSQPVRLDFGGVEKCRKEAGSQLKSRSTRVNFPSDLRKKTSIGGANENKRLVYLCFAPWNLKFALPQVRV